MIRITRHHKSDTAHQKYCVISKLEGGGKHALCRHFVTNENKISARTLVIKGLQNRFRTPGDHLEKSKTYLEQPMFENEDLIEHFKISH